MNALFIQENSLKVTLVTVLIFLLSLSTQMLVPLQASYVTQPQTHNVLPGTLAGVPMNRRLITTQVSTSSLPVVGVGSAVNYAYANSSVLGFELTGNIYDDSSAGFLIAHRSGAASKVAFTFKDATRVDPGGHEFMFTDYGNAVAVGGRLANPTTLFYEEKGLAPLKAVANSNGTVSILHEPDGYVAFNVAFSSLNSGNDYFVLESVNDGGRAVVILWGITAFGTYASGVYFDMQFFGLSSLSADSYVVHWMDSNKNDIADPGDTFDVVFSGTPQMGGVNLPPPPFDLTRLQTENQACYQYGTDGSKWASVDCLSKESVLKFGIFPTFKGIRSLPSGGQPASHLTRGQVQVNIRQYSGETDTASGAGAYSIQANTNDFTGSNGHNDWVQFVYQNGMTWARFCIWNVDVNVACNGAAPDCANPAGYNPSCVNPGWVGPLSWLLTSSYSATILGYIRVVFLSGLVAISFLESVLWIHDCAPNNWGVVSCADRSYAVQTWDTYGLVYNWVDISGGIMGAGGGSGAQFAGHHVSLETHVAALTCGQPCSSPILTAQYYDDGTTAEWNDLPQLNPVLACYFGGTGRYDAGTMCWLTTVSHN